MLSVAQHSYFYISVSYAYCIQFNSTEAVGIGSPPLTDTTCPKQSTTCGQMCTLPSGWELLPTRQRNLHTDKPLLGSGVILRFYKALKKSPHEEELRRFHVFAKSNIEERFREAPHLHEISNIV